MSKYQVVNVPSQGLSYKVDQIEARPLNMKDLAKLWKASQQADLEQAVDALGATLNQFPIMELTVPDFQYLLLWQRVVSYPRRPLKIDWSSRYGGDYKLDLTLDLLKFKYMNLDKDKVQQWRSDYGIKLPTVSDMLVYQKQTDPEKSFLFEKVQYVEGKSIDDRISKLTETDDLTMFELIAEFTEETDHGLMNSVEAVTPSFDKATAKKSLADGLQAVDKMLENMPSNRELWTLRSGLATDLENIDSESFAPIPEKITLPEIHARIFF